MTGAGGVAGSGALTRTGTSIWSDTAYSGIGTTNFNGDLSITGVAIRNLSNGRMLNLNGITTWSGNTAANNNAIQFASGATINKQSNTLTTLDCGITHHLAGITNVNAGTMQVLSAFTNNGLINAAAGATFLGSNASFINAGTLAGNGTIATQFNGDIVYQGIISPGNSGGYLTLDGTLTQTATGELDFELGSLASFDRSTVTNDVTLPRWACAAADQQNYALLAKAGNLNNLTEWAQVLSDPRTYPGLRAFIPQASGQPGSANGAFNFF